MISLLALRFAFVGFSSLLSIVYRAAIAILRNGNADGDVELDCVVLCCVLISHSARAYINHPSTFSSALPRRERDVCGGSLALVLVSWR